MASDLQEHPDHAAGAAAGPLPVYDADGRCLTDYGTGSASGSGGRTRTAEQCQVEAIAATPTGPVLANWLARLDLSVLPPAILVEVAAAVRRMQSAWHARLVQVAAVLAAHPALCPDWSDEAGGTPAQPSTGGDELAFRLKVPRATANRLVHAGDVLGRVLPDTWDALVEGRVDASRSQVLVDRVADLPLGIARAVEARVLPHAEELSLGEFRRVVDRAVIEADPQDAADRHVRARCARAVTRPRAEADGMASLRVLLPAVDATRVHGVLDHAARAARSCGDPRTLDQLRADGLRDLVVGDVPASDGPITWLDTAPRDPADREPVADGAGAAAERAAAGAASQRSAIGVAAAEPATTDGTASHAVPSDESAAHGVRPDGARPDPVPSSPNTSAVAEERVCHTCSGRPGAQVRVTVAASTLLGLDDEPAVLAGHGPIDAVQARALAAGGTWRRLVTDPTSGTLLDVGRTRYRPPAALDEHVRERDQRCAAPGCTASAWRSDLDHTIPYHRRPGEPPGVSLGATSAENLGPLCRRHHRLKTDGGHRLRQLRAGVFEWITPTGHRYLTCPGAGRTVDVTTRPPQTPPQFDEPPPF